MRRFLFISAIILICFLVEIILSTNFYFLRIRPNLLLLAVIFFTVYMGLIEGLFSAAIAGLLKDAFNLSFSAMNLLVFTICVLVINYLKKYIYRETFQTIFLTTIVIYFLNIFLDYLIGYSGRVSFLGVSFLFVCLIEIILNGLLAPFVFFYLKRCALKFYV